MRPLKNAGGHVGLTAREYPIAYNTAIREGQVVKLSGGKVISAVAAETGAILGIAAEYHSGAEDALNPRSNGTVILVYDNPELIFECDAPTFAAAGGSATTVTAATSAVACTTADAFNGGFLKLKDKGSESGNGDAPGTIKEVADFASASGTGTFTVASGETAGAGDEFWLFPPVGATAVCALDGTYFSTFVLTGAGCTKIKVIGHDLKRNKLRLMAVEHALGVEN